MHTYTRNAKRRLAQAIFSDDNYRQEGNNEESCVLSHL